MTTIAIRSDSRYKDTPVYATDDGKPFFSLLEPPEEFTVRQSDFQFHRVASHEIGFLDQLAVRYYGPGEENLWWAIALANNILDPELEMFTGQVLTVPSRRVALTFIGRTRRV